MGEADGRRWTIYGHRFESWTVHGSPIKHGEVVEVAPVAVEEELREALERLVDELDDHHMLSIAATRALRDAHLALASAAGPRKDKD